MSRNIKIFDTTLRDGEQAPGCSMNLHQKYKVARQLEQLKVDVIEAGFAIASDGDFEAIQAIARDILTEKAFHNAIKVDMALGCSTNRLSVRLSSLIVPPAELRF
jgi:isopropylmalate/homocitrate/citramalate synthase